MLERVIKKRRLEHGSQKRWSHPHSSTRRLDALAANPNPSPNPSLLPNLNPLLQTIPATASAAALNLSPIVSAVSAPSWMSMSSPPTTATSSPTPTSAGQATATPAPGNAPDRTSTTHSSGDASSTVNSGPLPRTASNYVSCSGSSQCVTITSTVIPTSSSTSSPNGSGSAGGVNAFFASLGSSAGSIFVTTLVGLAILGVIFAISSWGLRRWCNRRRKKIIDDDTWKFLNTPKEFFKGPIEDDDSSDKSLGHTFAAAPLPHVLTHNDAATQAASSHLFSTHGQAPHGMMNQMSETNANAPFHSFVGFHPAQPQRLSCFMDDGQMSWMSNPASGPIRSSIYGGVLLAPLTGMPTMPESAYGSPRVDQPLHGTLTEGLPVLRARSSVFAPLVDPVDDNTPLTQLPASLASRRTRQHPLARELSLACSDVSSTVEILRARVQDQRTDLRSKLIGAIQADATAPYVPVDRHQPATPRPLQFQKRPSLVRHQLVDEPILTRQASVGSCYSVTTTVIGTRHPVGFEQDDHGPS